MSDIKNNPRIMNDNRAGLKKVYAHQPLTIDHFGIQASIKENGKVVLSAVNKENSNNDVIEYDEIEVPASLIFKLANLLKDTRTIQFVPFGAEKTSKE